MKLGMLIEAYEAEYISRKSSIEWTSCRRWSQCISSHERMTIENQHGRYDSRERASIKQTLGRVAASRAVPYFVCMYFPYLYPAEFACKSRESNFLVKPVTTSPCNSEGVPNLNPTRLPTITQLSKERIDIIHTLATFARSSIYSPDCQCYPPAWTRRCN